MDPVQAKAEREAIHKLRVLHPLINQLTLAKRIRARDFVMPEDINTARLTNSRPVLSIYSVIRRFDAAKKSAVPQAA